MSSGLLITLELIIVLGVVLGLAGWELWTLRRDKKLDNQLAEQPDKSPDGNGPPR